MTRPEYLLDSNLCIYLLEGLSDLALRRMERQAPGTVVTSAIGYAEVLRKVESPLARAKVDRLFRIALVQPFDEVAARVYARLPLRRGSFDRLIAAHALALDVVLVTNNEHDFADILDLRTENWTRP